MKNLKLGFGMFVFSAMLVFTAQGQTNVIAVKSQAGEMVDVLDRADNFGAISQLYFNKQVDSVQFFKAEKMYVRYLKNRNDTVYFKNQSNSQILESIKTIGFDYPERTKFIGFPNGVYHGSCNSIKENSLSIWAVLIGFLFVGGIVVRNKSNA
jgi:hypothetical protein